MPARRSKPARPPRTPPAAASAGATTAADRARDGWPISLVLVLVAAGMLLRFGIAAVSHGTNDAAAFYWFGAEANRLGMLAAYQQVPFLNHPPAVLGWTAAAYQLVGGDDLTFPFVFKLPVLLAEGLIAWLVWRVWRDGRTAGSDAADRPRAGEAAAGYALSLVSVLVAAYHCNTDTAYAGLTLLSVWLLERRARPLAAGLALAAAVNVKLLPVIFVPALLLGCRSRREAGRFLAGLAVGVVPFVPVLLAAGEAYFRNAIAYGSRPDKWGVQLLLLPAG
ncbi:MAG TPA: glycosyltransferase 87 family protein, partial [Humisphaera sp.]